MRDILIKLLKGSGSRIYVVMLGFISLTLTARILGPDGRGQVVAVISWITTFSTIAHFSLGPVAMRQATLNYKNDWLSKAYSILLLNTVITISVMTIIFSVLLAFYPTYFGDLSNKVLLIGFCILPFMMWDNYGSHLLMGSNEVEVYNRSQIAGRTLGFLVLLFLLLSKNVSPMTVIFSNLIGFSVAALMMFRILNKKTTITFPSINELKIYYRDGALLHINAIGTFLFSGADILILNYMKGSSETGIYQLGIQLLGVILIIPQSAAMIVYSKIASEGTNKSWSEHKKIIYLITIAMSGIAVFLGYTVDFWLALIVGNKFSDSIEIFKFQLFSLPLMTFCTVMGPVWITRGYFWQASVVALSLAIINIVSNRLLIPEYGAYGAVWGSIASYSFASAINIALIKVCNKNEELFLSSNK